VSRFYPLLVKDVFVCWSLLKFAEVFWQTFSKVGEKML
jgi:hypothetical protein